MTPRTAKNRPYRACGEDHALDDSARAAVDGSFVRLSDGITHYRLAGPADGPLTVLTPGLTIPLGYWDDTAGHLHRRGLRTLSYSAYGRGWSDRITGPYDLRLFQRQLAELLDATAAGPAQHLVGASMGALIALTHLTTPATAAPRSLTLIGPAGFAAPNPGLQRLLRCPALARHTGMHLGRRILAQHARHNVRTPEDAQRLTRLLAAPARFEGTVHAVLTTLRDVPLHHGHDLYRTAGKLHVPTMLLWGRHDHITPIDQLPTVTDLLHPRSTHILDDHGHMLPFEAPAATAGHIADFATENPPAP
ncbi:alpha/beta fold hydrolase [Streptomyces sp. NBC_00690]|uniref:alpha/beta fold hydrolase n=1 Tax=Streptomyces sp. NBC_00690 TaxID=2975808 RepID=UPI002E2CDAC3|nr:alpha/beta hydrolase [Streptomyces sp. NBC_00690]